MPTYEYQCDRCGRFEAFQAITESPLERCPTCGGPVRRMISRNINILFKGSGFHVTDYRSSSYKEAAKKEQSTVSTSTGSD
ncbi:FmdB family zinc ribbon protein [Carboxydochorda subterranea]|uniref:FmdB family zinc ribbon protein n=1 Tax=Carboxydichorda subterranea TaxID=3109565 RepID=A0ABZ1BYK0_9FIRM|nr:FmdB family zinc ribbon protein [Limnochorda sp. L945t]WRP17852.1 FmdB family zinc ribbon protein [Limnochorda sp. L945t]